MVILITDGRAGLRRSDRVIAERLRRLKERVWIAVNKTEGMDPETSVAEFHELGLGHPAPISAAHGSRVMALVEAVLQPFPEVAEPYMGIQSTRASPSSAGRTSASPRFAGEYAGGRGAGDRAASPAPRATPSKCRSTAAAGSTHWWTCGRAAQAADAHGAEVEKFSIVKTLKAVEASNVAVLVLDAVDGISEQDAHVAVHPRGNAAGRWWWPTTSGMPRTRARASAIKAELGYKAGFLSFAEQLFISAKSGKGVNDVLRAVDSRLCGGDGESCPRPS